VILSRDGGEPTQKQKPARMRAAARKIAVSYHWKAQ